MSARKEAEDMLNLANRSPVWVSVVGWAILDLADAVRSLADRPPPVVNVSVRKEGTITND